MNNKQVDFIIKEIRTMMIGALDRFEQEFADEWGDRKPEDELTDEEFENRVRWLRARTAILDYGNKRIRNLEDYQRPDSYEVKFYTKPRRNKNG